MKIKIHILIVVFCFLVFPTKVAMPQIDQEVTIGSTPNPLGSGARALGMGSALYRSGG